jgi:GNAT superfamily N-acetyltransferase
MSPTYRIRPMTRADLDLAVDWAAAEGWNPGLHDADAFFATDPTGFFLGELGHQPIGCISAVSYGGAFGFVGFYIVQPLFRGQGYGIPLWQRAMQYLGDQPTGLDGVFAQQQNYARSGFAFAYRNLRFEYTGPLPAAEPHPSLQLLRDVPWDVLTAYDRACFPAAREPFLKKWVNLPDSHGLSFVENGRVRGYGLIRRCRSGYKIGPLFADDAPVARLLFVNLAARAAANEPVYLDVPEVNTPALRLAAEFGMTEGFGTARMYRGAAPAFDVNRVFGVTSFELG